MVLPMDYMLLSFTQAFLICNEDMYMLPDPIACVPLSARSQAVRGKTLPAISVWAGGAGLG